MIERTRLLRDWRGRVGVATPVEAEMTQHIVLDVFRVLWRVQPRRHGRELVAALCQRAGRNRITASQPSNGVRGAAQNL